MQEHKDELRDIRNKAYSSQSPSALKVLWHTAKALPQLVKDHSLPSQQDIHACMSSQLAHWDSSKPLVLDVGCGLGSFAAAYAQRCEAFAGENCHFAIPLHRCVGAGQAPLAISVLCSLLVGAPLLSTLVSTRRNTQSPCQHQPASCTACADAAVELHKQKVSFYAMHGPANEFSISGVQA
jgi:hypothetical protein